ncbi:MAG: GyrI-like domain-containing protein [Chitinophagaceae bacterium]|nr:GyrI-like domain-containing protein [Chitinophagaceae bacterium]
MQQVTSPAMTVMYSSHRTTIPQLEQFVAVVAKELYAEAAQQNLLVSGPQYWIYHGMDGNPQTEFTLEIAIPVQGKSNSSKFKTKELAFFKSINYLHEGAWEKMPDSYGVILKHIDENKIPMSDECREVYLNVDFEHPENNRVEIQMGIV